MSADRELVETFEKYAPERDILDDMHECDDDGFGCEYEDFFVDGQRYARCKLMRQNWDKLKAWADKRVLRELEAVQKTRAGVVMYEYEDGSRVPLDHRIAQLKGKKDTQDEA